MHLYFRTIVHLLKSYAIVLKDVINCFIVVIVIAIIDVAIETFFLIFCFKIDITIRNFNKKKGKEKK